MYTENDVVRAEETLEKAKQKQFKTARKTGFSMNVFGALIVLFPIALLVALTLQGKF